MNCKKLSFILLSTIPFTVHGMETRHWKARAVPVAYNKSTNEWSILLGHNKGKYWNDFGTDAHRGEKAHDAAARALSDQTNGVYKVQIAGTPYLRDTATGDIYHFVPVTFISRKILFKTAQSNLKDNFAWIPASELAKSSGDVSHRHHQKQVNVSGGFLKFLRKNWAEIEQKLNAFIEKSAGGTPAQPVPGMPIIEKGAKRYDRLSDFILDDNPHAPTEEEALRLVGDFENIYLEYGWVNSFHISYDELCNEDGSPLNEYQRAEIVRFMKANSPHATDHEFRFANNDFAVLAPVKGQNPMWKYAHNYLRRLQCLMMRLKGDGKGRCPSNKHQLEKCRQEQFIKLPKQKIKYQIVSVSVSSQGLLNSLYQLEDVLTQNNLSDERQQVRELINLLETQPYTADILNVVQETIQELPSKKNIKFFEQPITLEFFLEPVREQIVKDKHALR